MEPLVGLFDLDGVRPPEVCASAASVITLEVSQISHNAPC